MWLALPYAAGSQAKMGDSQWHDVLADPTIDAAGVWEVRPKQRVRIAVWYEQHWRPILWAVFGPDGSIYFAPRHQGGTMKQGMKYAADGTATIEYSEGEEVDPTSVRGGRVTVHASGVINLGRQRLQRAPLRNIQGPEKLCEALFQHPRAYAASSAIGVRDVLMPYPIDEERPLAAIFNVWPRASAGLTRVQDATRQRNILIECGGFSGTPDLTLEIVLWHGFVGPWPPYSYVYFRTPGPPP
jgi:hypothetical protein